MKLGSMKDVANKEVYSERAKLYANKILREVVLLMFNGYVYVL